VGRDPALALSFGELRFEPPKAQNRTLDGGTAVFFLEDHSLPLVTVYARFRGGYALLPRESYAAGTALPGLLRSGGTEGIPPDSVDHLIDYYALQTVFGGGGGSTFASMNTLRKHLKPALELWGEILRSPRFDENEVEVWRGREEESVRRRKDDPGRLAFSEFNRIMFGDHPIGWEMRETDLTPQRFSVEALRDVHGRVFCPENLILGVVGDVRWSEVEPLLEQLVEGWPSCQGSLLDPRIPEMRSEGGVFLIPRDLGQSTVVMAQRGGISQRETPDYFASRIGNSILGGSGFTSRILTQVRTERGYAYSASSLWTTPERYEGIVGAVTQTKSESTIATVQLILSIMSEMREVPPTLEEVDRAIAQIANGFVFNFQDPAQIVSRQMFYWAQDLPEDWLERYLRGIQEVRPEGVRRVFRRYVDPDEMVILILGNPDDFDLPLETLGEVQIWEVDAVTAGTPSGLRRGVQRSPR
jgi:predicted Zn-dependent peptidase